MRRSVRIACQCGTPPRVIATMVRDDEGRWRDWGSATTSPGASLAIRTDHPRSSVDLVGDRPAKGAEDWRDPEPENPERISHTLACSRCGTTVSLRGERLDPMLDKVLNRRDAGASIDFVPLGALTP